MTGQYEPEKGGQHGRILHSRFTDPGIGTMRAKKQVFRTPDQTVKQGSGIPEGDQQVIAES